MDERDSVAVEPRAGLRVDHVGASRGELADGYGDVGHLVGDVVHPRPRLARKRPTGVSSASARDELDPPGPHAGTRPRRPDPPCARAARPRRRRAAGTFRPPRRGPRRRTRRDGRSGRPRPDPIREGRLRDSAWETTCGRADALGGVRLGPDVGEQRLELGRMSVSFSRSAAASDVERTAVLGEEPNGLLEGVVAEAGLLLVANALRLLGERVVVGAHRPRGRPRRPCRTRRSWRGRDR